MIVNLFRWRRKYQRLIRRSTITYPAPKLNNFPKYQRLIRRSTITQVAAAGAGAAKYQRLIRRSTITKRRPCLV